MTKYYHSTFLSDILRYDGYVEGEGYIVTSMRTGRSFALTQLEWVKHASYPEIPEEDLEIRFLGIMDEPSVLEEYEQLAKNVSGWVAEGNWDLATTHIFRREIMKDRIPDSLLDTIWREHWTAEHREAVNKETERRRKVRLDNA